MTFFSKSVIIYKKEYIKEVNYKMIKRLKKIIKSKTFIFILGGILCSTITAYAVTYFPSNQVTYDNSTSKLNSTNVQGAIDELYKTCSSAQISGDYIYLYGY